MIAQNEIKVQGKLANKTDKRMVLDKHPKARLEHKAINCDCTIIR